MKIPVYVVTGFLDAGKTTFLNKMLHNDPWQSLRNLIIQFENGDMVLEDKGLNCEKMIVPIRALDTELDSVKEKISKTFCTSHFDAIWIEWNGMLSFTKLVELLNVFFSEIPFYIQKVVHVIDGKNALDLIGKTGTALQEQIANSDLAVIRNSDQKLKPFGLKKTLRDLNPDLQLYDDTAMSEIIDHIIEVKKEPIANFLMLLTFIVVFSILLKPILEIFDFPVNKFINVFLGIILQALPFLTIGVLLSSLIQVFVPQELIERRFPKSLGLGFIVAIVGGFLLPVCDCASIPIFKSLVKKGVPLPVAVTFMTVSPVINPVVILSTYYAFGGNMKFVMTRVILGIIVATLIGTLFSVGKHQKRIFKSSTETRLLCSCGCMDEAELIDGFKGKLRLFFRHAQTEFYNVAKYLMIATFISSLIQIIGMDQFIGANSGVGLAISILIMMGMAFFLSLCSSSDAIIARSLINQFPTGAIMGFLVFGPMLDLKNVIMLSSSVKKSFIIKFSVLTMTISFLVVFILSMVGGI
ncbi:permease [Fusibacter bizertensis]